jgi:hypothetical protein
VARAHIKPTEAGALSNRAFNALRIGDRAAEQLEIPADAQQPDEREDFLDAALIEDVHFAAGANQLGSDIGR